MARVSLDTLLRRSERNMGNGMNPIVKQSALEVIRRAYQEGINVQISQGMRTFAEQNRLYAQGRTSPGSIITNARGGQSNHNFGLAVDYFLTTWDGTKATWTVKVSASNGAGTGEASKIILTSR
jgi:peptidoglycan LD-endopeptidase CwlK